MYIYNCYIFFLDWSLSLCNVFLYLLLQSSFFLSTFSDISIATPAFSSFPFEMNTLFHTLTFCLLVYNLFLFAAGLHCCTWAFSGCGKQDLLFIAVHGLLIVVASHLLQSTDSRHTGFSSCGMWALELRLNSVNHWLTCSLTCGVLPDQGSTMSPASAGRFLSTVPPGKSHLLTFSLCVIRSEVSLLSAAHIWVFSF